MPLRRDRTGPVSQPPESPAPIHVIVRGGLVIRREAFGGQANGDFAQDFEPPLKSMRAEAPMAIARKPHTEPNATRMLDSCVSLAGD